MCVGLGLGDHGLYGNSVDILFISGSFALVIFGEPRWSGTTTCEAAVTVE